MQWGDRVTYESYRARGVIKTIEAIYLGEYDKEYSVIVCKNNTDNLVILTDRLSLKKEGSPALDFDEKVWEPFKDDY